MSDPQRVDAIAQANELPERPLSDQEVMDLIAFLEALTDHNSLSPHEDVPQRVPSGLPVFE
jgi:cytochrome c1